MSIRYAIQNKETGKRPFVYGYSKDGFYAVEMVKEYIPTRTYKLEATALEKLYMMDISDKTKFEIVSLEID